MGLKRNLVELPLLVQLLLLIFIRRVHCQSKVYLVSMVDKPVVMYTGTIEGYAATAPPTNTKYNSNRDEVRKYKEYLQGTHDNILATIFRGENYEKLYSYVHTINAFSAVLTEDQASRIEAHPAVLLVEKDSRVSTLTTYTPEYLNLTTGAWPLLDGAKNAGEDIVIGLVDTGITPGHASFANDDPSKPYGPLKSFTGTCEVAKEFPKGSCNNKIIGARHFAKAAKASGIFNATRDFDSPFDGYGHGTHTSSTAAGNHGVPVTVQGQFYGKASGMAPRARIAMYKSVYVFGGFYADVVAGIDQAVADGVDVLSLSLGPSGANPDINALYFTTFDIALLGATSAGVVVLQAVGNSGPWAESVTSWSPWIISVAASTTDRHYYNSITLGNGSGLTLPAYGLSVGTNGSEFYTIVSARDMNNASGTECKDAREFDRKIVEGNLLICNYSLFSEIIDGPTQAIKVAKEFGAVGVLFIVDDSLQSQDFSSRILPELIPSVFLLKPEAEKLQLYYNTTAHSPGKKFGATGRLGGARVNYTGKDPEVVYFSSRGPSFNNGSVFNRSYIYFPSDVLKPNVMAPGVQIWAAWTSAPNSPILPFRGEDFALLDGTSMSTPHVAGIAALVLERNPTFSPAAVHSAIAGTSFTVGKNGHPLLAQSLSSTSSASAFDMGSGQVNGTAALNPGLVFETGFLDYVKFLCITPTTNSSQVRNTTGADCEKPGFKYQSDLNTPYVSLGALNASRFVQRTVKSVGFSTEEYTLHLTSPKNVRVTVHPTVFSIAPGQFQDVHLNFQATGNIENSTFGTLRFEGNSGHTISIPLTIAGSHL